MANEIVGPREDGTRKIRSFTEYLDDQAIKLAGHLVRAGNEDIMRQCTFIPDTCIPLAPTKRRVGRPRYKWFEELLEYRNLDFVITAHHKDDNIETLVLRLLRGSGTKGARSIPINRKLGKGDIARPLLSLQKENLK